MLAGYEQQGMLDLGQLLDQEGSRGHAALDCWPGRGSRLGVWVRAARRRLAILPMVRSSRLATVRWPDHAAGHEPFM
jgi:hypothetical protein